MRYSITIPPLASVLVGMALITLTFSSCRAFPQVSPRSSVDGYANKTVSQLIDELTRIDAPSLGIDGASIYLGFIADDTPASIEVGVLGVPPPGVAPQMREIVRRGPMAVPELIKHLDDKRATKLMVGNITDAGNPRQIGVNEFMFTYFSAEYDPKKRTYTSEGLIEPTGPYRQRDFNGSYTVKVGDVCFVLIGQIVNRYLFAVRYQPTAGLVVNSPIEFPELAKKIKDDWGDADVNAVRTSLLADLDGKGGEDEVSRALQRLRLYFPETYNNLTGDDLKKRLKFETAEREQASHGR